MSEWNIKASNISKRAHNPIRQIVDKLKVDPNAQKSFISLSVGKQWACVSRGSWKGRPFFWHVRCILGDPTVFGNFNVHESANEAIKRQLDTFKHNGYPPAHGKYNWYEDVFSLSDMEGYC